MITVGDNGPDGHDAAFYILTVDSETFGHRVATVEEAADMAAAGLTSGKGYLYVKNDDGTYSDAGPQNDPPGPDGTPGPVGDDLPIVRIHERYEWDCPECEEVTDCGDLDPRGGVIQCVFCLAQFKAT